MVDEKQQHSFDELRLYRRSAHGKQRLRREHGSTLRDSPDIAGESEIPQIIKESFAEYFFPAEVLDILLREVQSLNVVYHLLESGADGVAAAVWHLAEEYIEICDAISVLGVKVAVAHGELVEIAQHGAVLFGYHVRSPYDLLYSGVPAEVRVVLAFVVKSCGASVTGINFVVAGQLRYFFKAVEHIPGISGETVGPADAHAEHHVSAEY